MNRRKSQDDKKVITFNRGKGRKGVIKDTILYIVGRSQHAVSPKQIAHISKNNPDLMDLNHSTVKRYVRQLHEKGLLLRLGHGMYVINKVTNAGVGAAGVWWGVHSIQFHVEFGNDECLPVEVKGFTVGFLEFRFTVGKRHRRVVVNVMVPKIYRWIHGIDAVCWPFILKTIFDAIEKACGFCPPVERWKLINLEPCFDIMGWRLDGCKCLTVYQYGEILKRLYNKVWSGEGLRDEARIVVPIKVSDVNAWMYGGLNSYNIKRHSDQLDKKYGKMECELRFNNVASWRALKVAEQMLRRREEDEEKRQAIMNNLLEGSRIQRKLIETVVKLLNDGQCPFRNQNIVFPQVEAGNTTTYQEKRKGEGERYIA